MFLVVGTQTHKSPHVTHTQPWRGVSQLWICLRGSVSQWELWPIESRIFITQSNPAPLTWAHYSRCWNGSPLTALLTWSAQHDALIANSLERAWRCWHVPPWTLKSWNSCWRLTLPQVLMARLWIWMTGSPVLSTPRLIYAVGSSTAPRLSKSHRYISTWTVPTHTTLVVKPTTVSSR